MGRKRGFRFLKYDEWVVQAHNAEPPWGLWWWRVLLPEERQHVLCVYFERRTYNTKRFNPDLSLADRWHRVCGDFKLRCAKQSGTPDEIEHIISLVRAARMTNPSSKGYGYFLTLEGAAIQVRLKRKNVYAWFARLDEIARELYTTKCPIEGAV